MTDSRIAPVRRIVLAYALVSFIWILLSDRAVATLFEEHALRQVAQTWKGWFFVLVTTGLLYWLLRRLYQRQLDNTEERVRLADQGAKSAALLQALIDASPDLVLAKDIEGRYVLFNREAERLSGRSMEQVIGREDLALGSAHRLFLTGGHDRLLMEQDGPVAFEEQLNSSGGCRTLLATSGPLLGPQGPVGTFTVARDISEMVLARQRLESGERRYKAMFDHNPLPMVVVDRKSLRFLAVNEKAALHYGYAQSDLLGMTLADISPAEILGDPFNVLGVLDQADTPRTVGPLVHWTRDRRQIEVNLSVCDIDLDDRPARLLLFHDVTERNRLQRERDTASSRLNDILSRVTDGFMAVNPDQYLTYLNQRAAEFIDAKARPQDLVGRLIWDLLPGAVGTRYAAAFFTAMEEGRLVVVEDWFAPWQRWIECRIYPSSGGASVYFSDISQRKAVELELASSQRALSALAARLMSQERTVNRRMAQALHDRLGQQLSSARLFLDVIQAAQVAGRQPPPDLAAKAIGLISEAISEVRHVLVDLRPCLLEEQGLVAALDNELRNSPAHGMGVKLSLEVAPEIEATRWPDAIEYAVFMVAREAIANALRHSGADTVVVALDGDGGYLVMQVRDNGKGMSALEREGVGGHLGMVGMRERTQAIGGQLAFETPTGGGTSVSLTVEIVAP